MTFHVITDHTFSSACVRFISSQLKARKLETRRKVLLGAMLSAWMQDDAALAKRVAETLPVFLTRQVDRDVFELDPLAPDARESNKAGTER